MSLPKGCADQCRDDGIISDYGSSIIMFAHVRAEPGDVVILSRIDGQVLIKECGMIVSGSASNQNVFFNKRCGYFRLEMPSVVNCKQAK